MVSRVPAWTGKEKAEIRRMATNRIAAAFVETADRIILLVFLQHSLDVTGQA